MLKTFIADQWQYDVFPPSHFHIGTIDWLLFDVTFSNKHFSSSLHFINTNVGIVLLEAEDHWTNKEDLSFGGSKTDLVALVKCEKTQFWITESLVRGIVDKTEWTSFNQEWQLLQTKYKSKMVQTTASYPEKSHSP